MDLVINRQLAVKALVDTGAEVTAIDRDLAAHLTKLEVAKTKRRVSGIDDSELNVVGKTKLDVEAGGVLTQVSAFIIVGLSPSCVGNRRDCTVRFDH